MGTKMTLHRYEPVTTDWKKQDIVIDQDFIDNNGLTIPLDYPVQTGLLDVFYMGQYVKEGAGYEVIDDTHIKFDLGVDDDGNPFQFDVGDELFIKIWSNKYCSRGEATVSGTDFAYMQKEIYQSKTYREEGKTYDSLDDRLDYIQKSLEIIESGMANVDISYEHNDKGQISRQIITGDYNLTRDFVFNEFNEIETETINFDGTTVTKSNTYDSEGKLLQTRVRVT